MAIYGQVPRIKQFSMWKREVDRLMLSEYAITIDEAGIDDAALQRHWETWKHAKEFVEWFGIKYDLTPVSAWSRSFRVTR